LKDGQFQYLVPSEALPQKLMDIFRMS